MDNFRDEEEDEYGRPRKRRKCSTAACERCKKKKIRCDSSVPCTGCAEANTECIFTKQKKRGPRPRNSQWTAENESDGPRDIVAIHPPPAPAASAEPTVVSDYMRDMYSKFFMDYINPIEPTYWESSTMTPESRTRREQGTDESISARFKNTAMLAYAARSSLHIAVGERFVSEARALLGQVVDDFSLDVVTGLVYLAAFYWGSDGARAAHFAGVARTVFGQCPDSPGKRALGELSIFRDPPTPGHPSDLSSLVAGTQWYSLSIPAERSDMLRLEYNKRMNSIMPLLLHIQFRFKADSPLIEYYCTEMAGFQRDPYRAGYNVPGQAFLEPAVQQSLLEMVDACEALVLADNCALFGQATESAYLLGPSTRLVVHWTSGRIAEARTQALRVVSLLQDIGQRIAYVAPITLPVIVWLAAFAVHEQQWDIARDVVHALKPLLEAWKFARDITKMVAAELPSAAAPHTTSPGGTASPLRQTSGSPRQEGSPQNSAPDDKSSDAESAPATSRPPPTLPTGVSRPPAVDTPPTATSAGSSTSFGSVAGSAFSARPGLRGAASGSPLVAGGAAGNGARVPPSPPAGTASVLASSAFPWPAGVRAQRSPSPAAAHAARAEATIVEDGGAPSAAAVTAIKTEEPHSADGQAVATAVAQPQAQASQPSQRSSPTQRSSPPPPVVVPAAARRSSPTVCASLSETLAASAMLKLEDPLRQTPLELRSFPGGPKPRTPAAADVVASAAAAERVMPGPIGDRLRAAFGTPRGDVAAADVGRAAMGRVPTGPFPSQASPPWPPHATMGFPQPFAMGENPFSQLDPGAAFMMPFGSLRGGLDGGPPGMPGGMPGGMPAGLPGGLPPSLAAGFPGGLPGGLPPMPGFGGAGWPGPLGMGGMGGMGGLGGLPGGWSGMGGAGIDAQAYLAALRDGRFAMPMPRGSSTKG